MKRVTEHFLRLESHFDETLSTHLLSQNGRRRPSYDGTGTGRRFSTDSVRRCSTDSVRRGSTDSVASRRCSRRSSIADISRSGSLLGTRRDSGINPEFLAAQNQRFDEGRIAAIENALAEIATEDPERLGSRRANALAAAPNAEASTMFTAASSALGGSMFACSGESDESPMFVRAGHVLV